MRAESRYLDQQRPLGDNVPDQLTVEHLGQDPKEFYSLLHKSSIELKAMANDSPTAAYLVSSRPRPGWYSDERIVKGQQVFAEYASEIMTLLGVLSLPYLYAGSPGNKALFLSDKMRNSPGKRLMDTAEFVIAVCSPGGFSNEGESQYFINRTRLIHAIARYYVLKSRQWDMDWGMPINQEDMAGTNLGFSYILLNGLRKSGFDLNQDQKEDFIYLWKYIGYQLGIDEQLLPSSYQEAFTLTNLIKHRNFKKSAEGEKLTEELLAFYKSVAPPDKSDFIESQVRYFLGSKVAGYLGIKKDPVKDSITKAINSFQELQNYFGTHKNSYGEMIKNHQKARKSLV